MKIGVAISLYNKVDHLKTNISIIRKHWAEKNVFISVCCNDKNSHDLVKKLKIDAFSTGNYEIQSTPKPFRRLRIFDCIKTSILNCKSDYIIHYHADAYALESEKINELIKEMELGNFYVAFRGKGLDYRNSKNICGDVDDHFCIFNRAKVLEHQMFNVDYEKVLRFLHVGNPETLLSKLIQETFEKENILHYSKMEDNEVGTDRKDDFYSDNIMHRDMTPYNFDNQRKFLHFGNVEKKFIIDNLVKRGVNKDLIDV